MESLIIIELKSKLKLKDWIFVCFFKKQCIRIYKMGIEKGINMML